MDDIIYQIHEEDIFLAQLQKKEAYVQEIGRRLRGLEAYFQISREPREHIEHGFVLTPMTKAFPAKQHIHTKDLTKEERRNVQFIHDRFKTFEGS